jgi:hypothetical protein
MMPRFLFHLLRNEVKLKGVRSSLVVFKVEMGCEPKLSLQTEWKRDWGDWWGGKVLSGFYQKLEGCSQIKSLGLRSGL